MRPWRPPAFTLIELLAVIAIGTLVTALSGMSIAATANHTAFVRTIAMFKSMDAHARMFARGEGQSVTLSIDPQSRLTSLIGSRAGEVLASAQVPSSIQVTLETEHTVPELVFDRAGTSQDYTVLLRNEIRSVRLSMAGLTGEIRTQEEPP